LLREWINMPYFFISDKALNCDGCGYRIDVGDKSVRCGKRYFHLNCYKILYADYDSQDWWSGHDRERED